MSIFQIVNESKLRRAATAISAIPATPREISVQIAKIAEIAVARLSFILVFI